MINLKSNRALALGAAVAATFAIAVPASLAAGGSGGIGAGGGGADPTEPPETTPPPTTETTATFPLRGRYKYGDGLGAGRNHQGQDLMAKCGKPILAVYPGRVQKRAYHGAAGNYIVIDGKGRLEDTVYMHLRRPSKLRPRQRVRAGQVIGRVGDTGNASACHLHFEIWSEPGYYEGGHPLDPTPILRRLDPKRGR